MQAVTRGITLPSSRRTPGALRRVGAWFALAAALALVAGPALARSAPSASELLPHTPFPHEDEHTSSYDPGLGQTALVQADLALVAAQSQFDNIKVRLAALRGSSRDGGTGLAFKPGTAPGPLAASFQSFALAQDDAGNGDSGGDFSRWGSFLSMSAGDGNVDPGLVTPGSDFDSFSFTAGLDYRYSDAWILGGTLGYGMQEADLDANDGYLDAKGWSLSAYSSYANENNWYADFVASFGRSNNDLRRVVGAQTLLGNPDVGNFSFAASIGRDFNSDGWSYGPYARLLYTRLSFDRFVERISGIGPLTPQVIDTEDFTALSAVVGGKLTYTHSTANGVVIPHLQVEWQHEMEDDASIVETSFVGGFGATTITGDRIDSSYGRVGLGLSFVFTGGRSGFLYYERMFARDRYSLGQLAMGFRTEF